MINEIDRENSKISTSLDIIAGGHFVVDDFVEGPESILLKMYDEDEVSLLPPWADYAGHLSSEIQYGQPRYGRVVVGVLA